MATHSDCANCHRKTNEAEACDTRDKWFCKKCVWICSQCGIVCCGEPTSNSAENSRFPGCARPFHCDSCKVDLCSKCSLCNCCGRNHVRACDLCNLAFCKQCCMVDSCEGCWRSLCDTCQDGDGLYILSCDICEKVLCEDCGSITLCDECDKYKCEECDEMKVCGICGVALCGECTTATPELTEYCDGCQRDLCCSCHGFATCVTCGKQRCADCDYVLTCEKCQEAFCPSCRLVIGCESCGKQRCAQCAKPSVDFRLCGQGVTAGGVHAVFCVECASDKLLACEMCGLDLCLICFSKLASAGCPRCSTIPSKALLKRCHLRRQSQAKNKQVADHWLNAAAACKGRLGDCQWHTFTESEKTVAVFKEKLILEAQEQYDRRVAEELADKTALLLIEEEESSKLKSGRKRKKKNKKKNNNSNNNTPSPQANHTHAPASSSPSPPHTEGSCTSTHTTPDSTQDIAPSRSSTEEICHESPQTQPETLPSPFPHLTRSYTPQPCAALLAACKSGSVADVRVLIEGSESVDVDARGPDGRAPLEVACDNGNGQIAELLIDAGADVHGKVGSASLEHSSRNGLHEVAQLLRGLGVRARCNRCGEMESEVGVDSLGFGMGGQFRPCSKCQCVWYCGEECRLEDWPQHEKVCTASKPGESLHYSPESIRESVQ